jgi:hypothetical protein
MGRTAVVLYIAVALVASIGLVVAAYRIGGNYSIVAIPNKETGTVYVLDRFGGYLRVCTPAACWSPPWRNDAPGP